MSVSSGLLNGRPIVGVSYHPWWYRVVTSVDFQVLVEKWKYLILKA